MKKLIYLFVISCFFASCSADDDEDLVEIPANSTSLVQAPLDFIFEYDGVSVQGDSLRVTNYENSFEISFYSVDEITASKPWLSARFLKTGTLVNVSILDPQRFESSVNYSKYYIDFEISEHDLIDREMTISMAGNVFENQESPSSLTKEFALDITFNYTQDFIDIGTRGNTSMLLDGIYWESYNLGDGGALLEEFDNNYVITERNDCMYIFEFYILKDSEVGEEYAFSTDTTSGNRIKVLEYNPQAMSYDIVQVEGSLTIGALNTQSVFGEIEYSGSLIRGNDTTTISEGSMRFF